MDVEIISIGDELLIGQVINTNCAVMAQILNDKGFNVKKVTTIADDSIAIKQGITSGIENSDCVLITGGLGPTKDDITKFTLAKMFDSPMIEDKKVLETVRNIFAKRGFPLTETNRTQALVPQKCKVIYNPIGTAPGMCFEKDGKLIISMPGVPFEMENMMRQSVIPLLIEHYKPQTIIHKTFVVQGISESFLSDLLEDFEKALPSFIHLAYLPKASVLRLRLTAKGENKTEILKEIEKQSAKLLSIIDQYFIGYDEDNLAIVLSKLLIERHATLSTAESCTGGNIAHRITLNAGASEYFKGSIVSYANEAKMNLLCVKEETLNQMGAVSKQTAMQMACGAIKALHTTYAIATTGIAGPSGATETKPVGTVWIALANSNGECIATEHKFFSSRENFIDRVTNECFAQLIRWIQKRKQIE